MNSWNCSDAGSGVSREEREREMERESWSFRVQLWGPHTTGASEPERRWGPGPWSSSFPCLLLPFAFSPCRPGDHELLVLRTPGPLLAPRGRGSLTPQEKRDPECLLPWGWGGQPLPRGRCLPPPSASSLLRAAGISVLVFQVDKLRLGWFNKLLPV